MTLEDTMIEKLTPSARQARAMAGVVAELEAVLDDALAAARLPGKARVQGSVAKGTWLQGATDLDCFLLLDETVSDERLKAAAEEVGTGVLENIRHKYAQHPYLIGEFHGMEVDLVPAYAVADAGSKMSAVDRTPFHTAWVAAHLDDAGRGQVRLAKRWCKGVGVYGAETAIGGFSGYLIEVLVVHLGNFQAFLAWLASGPEERRIATGADEVEDDVSPLVVVDPVDPARNCAAAVRGDILALAAEAAEAYLAAPAERFFFPPDAKPARGKLKAAMQEADQRWLALRLRPTTDRLDIVFPQFQKTARQIAEELARSGWAVARQAVHASPDESEVLMHWIAEGHSLETERIQTGPPADSTHGDRFRKKWDGHPDAAGPIHEHAGRLQVAVHVRERDAEQYLRRHLERLLVAKHVKAAWKDGEMLVDPEAVKGPWAPWVADLVLDRRPWNR